MEGVDIPCGEARALALAAFGAPNQQLSSKSELRFGAKGSIAINLQKNNGFNFETGEAIGLLDMVQVAGFAASKPDAAEWLKRNRSINLPQNEEISHTDGRYMKTGVTLPEMKAIILAAENKTKAAANIWSRCYHEIGGNAAIQTYLSSRGVELPRDSFACGWLDDWHGLPAMICAISDPQTGSFLGVHITMLKDGKRFERRIKGKKERVFLEADKLQKRAGAMLLSPIRDVKAAGILGVGEGIETSLSLRRIKGFETIPVWSLIDAGNMSKFEPPPYIKRLVIAIDHDHAGIAAASELEARCNKNGVQTQTLMHPVANSDLNDFFKKDN